MRRITVEECFCLSVATFLEDGVFASAPGSRWSFTLPGLHPTEFAVGEAPGAALALIFHAHSTAFQSVRVTTTKPHFGGLRYWFKCPVVRKGTSCHRRVGRLYLPPGATLFGCRTCYGLTYRSSQTHDARVDTLRRDPFALLGALHSARLSDKLLAIKACARNLRL